MNGTTLSVQIVRLSCKFNLLTHSYCDDLHGFVTARAAQGALAGLRPAAALGIRLVDLLDQAGPRGAALLGRHRQLGLRLLGRTEADGWLGWMVALPALGSEAEEVRATGPGAASPRGVQAVGAIMLRVT